MAEKSIDLCGMRGDQAVELLFNKVGQPDLPLCIGSTSLTKITKVEHIEDGRPVISAVSNDNTDIVFQFDPGYTSFSATAMGQDGEKLCPEEL